MYNKLLLLFNVKPHESMLVRKLFTIQFFLGVATAFLFTSSLTMFLSNYEIKVLPVAYILSACLLLVFNRIYSYLDEKINSPRLLEIVIFFSAISILVFWILFTFFPFKQLPLILSGWYMLIYMLVGYAFWGMASIIFNVRESKRLFSIVGAGDIPAKMLGYFSVTALVRFINVNNLLWISILSFIVALFLLQRFQKQGFLVEDDPNAPSHAHEHHPEHSIHNSGLITKFFNNNLVLCISLLSLISYIVFALIDFTFLSDIKVKFKHEAQLATFIAVFFAIGRFMAIGIKLLFSSRMISKLGLANSLLVTPVLLLLIDLMIILFGDRFISQLYVFGFMVLLTEILRSALQEPVFFILFQPLKPHDRLRGHLVAKGHTMPFALLPVGLFLFFYLKGHEELPILSVAKFLIFLLSAWIIAVFLIKKEYLRTLIASLKKGYFTGAELFLNDNAVISLLIKKTESHKPLEVIHSLNLLERSGYADIYKLLLKKLTSTSAEIKEYVLQRILENNMTGASPLIQQHLNNTNDERLQGKLIKAYYFLNKETGYKTTIPLLSPQQQKAAMEGLLLQKNSEAEGWVISQLTTLSAGSLQDKLIVLDVIISCQCEHYTGILKVLLADDNAEVYKKAIEAAGKSKNFELFAVVTKVAVSKKAYNAFKHSLQYYGDEAFASNNWGNISIPEDLLNTVIKTCGNIKGENSTKFLVKLLSAKSRHTNEIIEALWLKKSKLQAEDKEILDNWVGERIEESRHKVTYYYEVYENKPLKLLQDAVLMELKKDLQLLLKAFALLYEREKVDRVIELVSAGNTGRISNAIEVLELIIPKKYFSQINVLQELVDDVQHNKALAQKTNNLSTAESIEEVIKNSKANFTEWTKSIACYTLPKLQKKELSLRILDIKVSKEDHLFDETRNYVLSMLK